MIDTKQICEAIKGLPDNDRLQLHVRPVYKSDEWGMNRYLTTESDASIATNDLKVLVAENEALRQKLNCIAFYVKDHSGHLPPCDLCLIEGIVSGDILPIETTYGGNDE